MTNCESCGKKTDLLWDLTEDVMVCTKCFDAVEKVAEKEEKTVGDLIIGSAEVILKIRKKEKPSYPYTDEEIHQMIEKDKAGHVEAGLQWQQQEEDFMGLGKSPTNKEIDQLMQKMASISECVEVVDIGDLTAQSNSKEFDKAKQ